MVLALKAARSSVSRSSRLVVSPANFANRWRAVCDRDKIPGQRKTENRYQ